MAKKTRLIRVSESIGSTLGKADRKARKLKDAGDVAKEELHAIGRQVEELKKQLARTTDRLKKALS